MKKRCVREEDIACPKARDYLKKHGLICSTDEGPPRPKPTPAGKKSLLDEWLG